MLLSDGTLLNLARLTRCELARANAVIPKKIKRHDIETVVLLITDERNALERVLLHFAHFEKRVERVDELRYRLSLQYDRADEAELVMRVLSFGSLIKAEAPEHFVSQIRARLLRQKKYGPI